SCFFFQAEDGIRDFHVTGVQTCALPIFQDLAVPDCDHLAADRLLRRGVRDDDPARRGPFLLDTLYHDAVMQRTNLHVLPSLAGRLRPKDLCSGPGSTARSTASYGPAAGEFKGVTIWPVVPRGMPWQRMHLGSG